MIPKLGQLVHAVWDGSNNITINIRMTDEYNYFRTNNHFTRSPLYAMVSILKLTIYRYFNVYTCIDYTL